MDPLLKKMNFKEGMKIMLFEVPNEFQTLSHRWQSHSLSIENNQSPDLILGFISSKKELEMLFPVMNTYVTSDQIFWLAYPKKSSKTYKTDISRDSGWALLGEYDFEGVRQVSLNEDWSALRFRKIEFIKKMTRNFSLKDQK